MQPCESDVLHQTHSPATSSSTGRLWATSPSPMYDLFNMDIITHSCLNDHSKVYMATQCIRKYVNMFIAPILKTIYIFYANSEISFLEQIQFLHSN